MDARSGRILKPARLLEVIGPWPCTHTCDDLTYALYTVDVAIRIAP